MANWGSRIARDGSGCPPVFVLFSMWTSLHAAGCVIMARPATRYEVSTPPPAPAAEVPVLCPPGYNRIPGHWRWNGFEYAWIAQRCAYRPGYRYEPGGYYQCGEGWCFREGSWVQVSASAQIILR